MSEYDSRNVQDNSDAGSARSNTTNASFFSQQFGKDGQTPKVIQDRIKKRKPNPGCHLTSKKFAAIRFASDRCTRGITTRAKWHDVDDKANKNGLRQLIVLDDGTEYVGEWQNNLRHGMGKHYTAEGFYDGGFYEDLYDGKGDYFVWSDKTNCEQPGLWYLYTGEWEAGKFAGQGTKYELNGDVYTGEFSKGKKCGQGQMYYANKDEYQGEWANDMRNGKGTLTKKNGDKFVGIYKDDKRNGEGVLHILETKRRLEGVWVDDMMKCGSYYDEQEDPVYVQPDDISGTTDGMIPKLTLKDPEGVLQEAKSKIDLS
ncbi:hypothetical protein M9Y10_045428 [Tritrichomonas musculus]|uniref:MORN repeat-containing protein 3 n=1 Tax=Tritrichomonas musculus TaxID=1915356 RepID=A0ABR2JV78_9EUKA